MKEQFANREVAMLIELRQFLDDGRFVEVLDHIGLVEADTNLSLSNAYRARLLSLKGTAFMKLNQYEDALEVARAGLNLIKHSSDNQLIAELQAIFARSLTELGQVTQAERIYRDLIATYRRLDDPVSVIRSLNRLSRVHFIEGQFGKAADALLEAEDYARALNDSKWLAMTAGNLGTILMLSGEFNKAIEHFEESLDLNATLDEQSNFCKAHLCLAFCQMHLSRFEAASNHLDTAEELVDSTGVIADRVNLIQYRAQLALLQKQFAEARRIAAAALQLAREWSPACAEVAQIGRLLAEAEFGLGHLELAATTATAALKSAQEVEERVEAAACRRLLAQIDHELHGSPESVVAMHQVCHDFEQIGARYELAQARLALAQVASDPILVREARDEAMRILRGLRVPLPNSAAGAIPTSGSTESTTVIGVDPAFFAIVRDVEKIAESDLSVLLLGPTGSGKDLVAKFIHEKSNRRKGKFVQVNCGAIPMDLAESELFGHERGAFTSADATKVGLMEIAAGGTLFLNEVGELPERLQVKLLSAIEEKSFYRLGSTVPRKADFRMIAATNVDLLEAVRQGRFRADLYFRLAVMTKQLPKLSERGEDAYLLFRHFLEVGGISLDAVDRRTIGLLKERIVAYEWPGNVREMKNLLDMLFVAEKRDPRSICLRMIDKLSRQPLDLKKPVLAESICLTEQVEEYERSKISTALDICDGIIRRAAAYLGIPEGTLRSKMKKYRISAA